MTCSKQGRSGAPDRLRTPIRQKRKPVWKKILFARRVRRLTWASRTGCAGAPRRLLEKRSSGCTLRPPGPSGAEQRGWGMNTLFDQVRIAALGLLCGGGLMAVVLVFAKFARF
jgi:hypothetical protein